MPNYALGFVAVTISSLGFGTNFIPLKKYDMGDGMFFQWVMALGIWLFGAGVQVILVYAFNQTPYAYPFAFIGGAGWALGNALTVSIVKMIGLALGLVIWAATSIILGWGAAEFGFLGVHKAAKVDKPYLNYLGVLLILFSLPLFFFVKPDLDDKEEGIPRSNSYVFHHIHNPDSPLVTQKRQHLLDEVQDPLKHYQIEEEIELEESWVDKLSDSQKQVWGVICSVFAGVMYGIMFNPVTVLVYKHDSSPSNRFPSELIDYAFAMYSGILLMSSIIFICYAVYMKNKPQMNKEIVLPALASAFIWASAHASWFVSMDQLGQTISFPLTATCPQLVASCVGVFVFREITGQKNLLLLAVAFCVAISGVVCITLSKF